MEPGGGFPSGITCTPAFYLKKFRGIRGCSDAYPSLLTKFLTAGLVLCLLRGQIFPICVPYKDYIVRYDEGLALDFDRRVGKPGENFGKFS